MVSQWLFKRFVEMRNDGEFRKSLVDLWCKNKVFLLMLINFMCPVVTLWHFIQWAKRSYIRQFGINTKFTKWQKRWNSPTKIQFNHKLLLTNNPNDHVSTHFGKYFLFLFVFLLFIRCVCFFVPDIIRWLLLVRRFMAVLCYRFYFWTITFQTETNRFR